MLIFINQANIICAETKNKLNIILKDDCEVNIIYFN